MLTPSVSIVTPSYNQAQYLEATILSVLNQGYPNLEFVVVDGQSTDGSQEIIKKYQNQLSWWISEPDLGQADAINKGFRRTSGNIVGWLNSDDLHLPWTIKEAVKIFSDNPEAGLVYGDAVSADSSGKLLNELRFEQWDLSDLLMFKIICQPAVFIRRDVLNQVGLLDPSYHFFLDHELWIRIARQSKLIHHPQIWAVSRYHSQAKNVTMAEHAGQDVWRILEWIKSEADLENLFTSQSKQILAGANQINARYLLDSGKPSQAFRAYIKAAKKWPPSIRGYWHRLLFSGLSVIGLDFLGKWYYSLKGSLSPPISQNEQLLNWPGIKSS
jgi:glycosyltransferase involved in cell wall biosynthesis